MASKVTSASMSGGLGGLVWVGELIAFSWGPTLAVSSRRERMRASGLLDCAVG